jgi:hypothetical protein
MLLILQQLCDNFAVIDTERGRSRKYVGVDLGGGPLQFQVAEPHEFSPESLIEAIAKVQDMGCDGVGIDTGSAYWAGAGGMLERVDLATQQSGRKDSFGSGWKEMTPIERHMWAALLSFEGHLVMNLRVQDDYVIQAVERNGKTSQQPTKVGLRPVQRRGFDYEFDLVLAMGQDNTATVMKSDIMAIPQGDVVTRLDLGFTDTLREFCAEGGERAVGPLMLRKRALDPAVTFDLLGELRDEVIERGLEYAAVMDGEGKPTTLLDLVRARGRTVKPAPSAAPQQRSAPSTQDKPAPPAEDTAAAAPKQEDKPAAPKAPTKAQLNKVIKWLLDATDQETIDKQLATMSKDERSEIVIGPLIPEDAAEALGIVDGDHQGEPIDLGGLASMLSDYAGRHDGKGPRHPDLLNPPREDGE